jgi:hypothetical protein
MDELCISKVPMLFGAAIRYFVDLVDGQVMLEEPSFLEGCRGTKAGGSQGRSQDREAPRFECRWPADQRLTCRAARHWLRCMDLLTRHQDCPGAEWPSEPPWDPRRLYVYSRILVVAKRTSGKAEKRKAPTTTRRAAALGSAL